MSGHIRNKKLFLRKKSCFVSGKLFSLRKAGGLISQLCMRSPGVKGIFADALLCDSLSCQSLRFVVEARYSTEFIQREKEEL